MSNELDTLLTALYVDLKDRVLRSLGWSWRHRFIRRPAFRGLLQLWLTAVGLIMLRAQPDG